MRAKMLQKHRRPPKQQKIDSRLLYAMRAQRGLAMTAGGEVTTLRSAMSIAKSATSASKDGGLALVNIRGEASKDLVMKVEKLGGEVINASVKNGMIRARMPLSSLETLAGDPHDRFIRAAYAEATTNSQMPGANGTAAPLRDRKSTRL